MKTAVKYLIIIVTICLLPGCGGGNKSNKEPKELPLPVEKPDTLKPVINAYIENSGSMDGYVKGGTEFKSMVYNYLSDIKISKITDSLNLYYINSEVISLGTVSEEMDVLKDFIEKLDPKTFKIKGGNLGTSDIADVIKSVMQKTDDHTISLLVTDGIFSPGKGKNAQQYIVNQEIGIKNSFATFLEKEKNAAVIVYQLSSQFDGIYYDKIDTKIPFIGQRPFYIWVIGKAKHLVALTRAVPESKFNGQGVQNVFSIMPGNQQVKYAVNPSIGKFKKSKKDPQKTIESLEKDSHTGKVKFAVNVDFSGLLLDENYLLDTANYENSSKYALEIKPSSTKNMGYTHVLNFSSDKVYKGTVSIKLKDKCPDWVERVNDDDGSTPAKGKTYGIKYQINGVFKAFTFDDEDKYYTEIKININ